MDRLTYAIAGGVVALVLVGLAVAAYSRGREPAPDLDTPAGVVLAYALAEQRGDGQAAWDLLAASAQARGDRDRFIARVTSKPAADREYLSTEAERLESDGATVVLVRTSPGSGGLFGNRGYTARSTVRLSRAATGWRITIPPDDFLLTPPRQP